jgi:hypothetical protein
MKTNKKAIFGFATAMIFSMALMQGISKKSNEQDMSLQQLGAACAVGASYSEDGGAWEAGLEYGAVTLGGVFVGMGSFGAQATLATGGAASANPVGWGYWVATGIVGL